MIALDTDVFTDFLYGEPSIVQRLARDPLREYMIPALVIEEILRGRLNLIRRAEARRTSVSIDHAYLLLQQTVEAFRTVQILSYTAVAEAQFQEWRRQKIRVPTHDLRIAATCAVTGATLVSRNRRDFDLVPGLMVEYW
jgi:tRNA(fMet)-specific endonuclease VapC